VMLSTPTTTFNGLVLKKVISALITLPPGTKHQKAPQFAIL